MTGTGVAPDVFGAPIGRHFVLLDKIGSGAMGTVYRGAARESDEPVAIKVLRPELAEDHRFVARFVQERTILTRLRDGGVVTVHDMVVERDTLAIVMEFMAGGSLRQHVARGDGRLPEAEAVAVMAQIFEGLAHAHAQGIVHRDVKPENILLGSSESWPPVKLSDFGISGLADDPVVTKLTGKLGTPTYMAPELTESEAVTAAVDLYSAGIVLYELVEGRPPFRGPNPMAVLKQHAGDEPLRPASISDQIWELTKSLLEKDPDSRPTAVEARALLGTLPGQEGIDEAAPISEPALIAPSPPEAAARANGTDEETIFRDGRTTEEVTAPMPPERRRKRRRKQRKQAPDVVVEASVAAPVPEDLQERRDGDGGSNTTILRSKVDGEDEPVDASQSPRAGQLSRLIHSRRAVIIGSCVVGLIVLGLAAYVTVGAIAQRNGYFARVDRQGTVEIFKGQPTSFLWFGPTRVSVPPTKVNHLEQADPLANGSTVKFATLKDATRYIKHSVDVNNQNLAAEKAQEAQAAAAEAAQQAATQTSSVVNQAMADLQTADNADFAIWGANPEGTGAAASASNSSIAAGLQNSVIPNTNAAAALMQNVSSSDATIQKFITAYQGCISAAQQYENAFLTDVTDGNTTDTHKSVNNNVMNPACEAAASASSGISSPGWQPQTWPSFLSATYTTS